MSEQHLHGIGFLTTADPTVAPGADPVDQPFRVAPGDGAELESLLRDGLVRRVLADVLAPRSCPEDDWSRARAVALLLPPGTDQVLGFASAAWVLTGVHSSTGRPPPFLDVLVPPGRRRPQEEWVRGRQAALPEADVVEMHGVLLTSPLRTAADVARDLPGVEALTLLHALARVGVRPWQVRRQLGRMKYARGSTQARRVLRAWEECL